MVSPYTTRTGRRSNTVCVEGQAPTFGGVFVLHRELRVRFSHAGRSEETHTGQQKQQLRHQPLQKPPKVFLAFAEEGHARILGPDARPHLGKEELEGFGGESHGCGGVASVGGLEAGFVVFGEESLVQLDLVGCAVLRTRGFSVVEHGSGGTDLRRDA
jgi:hypothetical protein